MKKQTRRVLSKSIIVFCEDEKSSKMYLEELYKQYRNQESVFSFEKCPINGDYINMIESSLLKIEKNEKEIKPNKYKNKYIVVDLDRSRENSVQMEKLRKFENIAEKNGVNIVYCDPNFEMYLLLHFEFCCPENVKTINQKLMNYINKTFNKNILRVDDIKKDISIFKKICSDMGKVKNAINNNKSINKNNNNKMNFYELVELIIRV